MSRCSDQAHIEQSSRQFIQICQHAGRIFHEVIKTKVVLHVVFTRFNDVFYSENMKMVNGNTLGLDTPERPAEVAWSEIRASAVRICMFPYIAAIFEEMGGALHVLCKSNVLLV